MWRRNRGIFIQHSLTLIILIIVNYINSGGLTWNFDANLTSPAIQLYSSVMLSLQTGQFLCEVVVSLNGNSTSVVVTVSPPGGSSWRHRSAKQTSHHRATPDLLPERFHTKWRWLRSCSLGGNTQWRTEAWVWGGSNSRPPSKFRSFAKPEPNSQFRGTYIRNYLIRI
jgi:hypothetical protein